MYALLSFSHNDTTRKFFPSTIHFFDASYEVFYNSIQLQRVFDTEASKKEKLIGLIVKQWDGVAGKCGKKHSHRTDMFWSADDHHFGLSSSTVELTFAYNTYPLHC